MPSRTIQAAKARINIRRYINIGILILFILLITLATAGKQQILRCERQEGGGVDCEVRQSLLGVITLNKKTTTGVEAISMGQQCDDISCKYRLEMYTTLELVPVTEKYTSDHEWLQQIREQINAFIKDKSRTFIQVKEQTNPVLMIALVAVVVITWAYLGYLIWQARRLIQNEQAV